jgi:TonB-dependent receptor
MPLQDYSLTAGIPLKTGNGSLGVVAALTYRHEENTEELLEAHMITRDSIFTPSGKGSYRYRFVTSTGAVLNAGWQTKGHGITWRNLFNNRFSHTNHQRFVRKYYEGYDFAEQYSVPLASRLWQTQLDGKHSLFGDRLTATWNASYNKITRTNPDDRLASGRILGESPAGASFINWGEATDHTNILTVSSGHTMYSRMNESRKNIGVALEHPFTVRGNRQGIKAGYAGTFRSAAFEQQYLKAMNRYTSPYSINSLPVEEFYAPEHFGGNPLEYEPASMKGPRSDYYTGHQDIHAGYLIGDFSFFRKLRLTGGVRMENTDMEVTTHIQEMTVGGGLVDSTAVIKRTDWLPAGTLIYSITQDLNARVSYGKTLARPDFRELSLSHYYNVDDRIWVVNGSRLEQSDIHNFDARIEWYPGLGEVISVGYFRKKFIKPVELIMRELASGQSYELHSLNLDESVAGGFELNLRKSMGFITPALNSLYFTGNGTWMKANVKYNSQKLLQVTNPNVDPDKPDPQFDRDRPLRGLSPYSVNLGFAYDGSIIGAAVNYNRAGRRLVVAGEYEKYDQFENPRNVLDLQLSARLLKQRMEIRLNAGDVLNEDIIVYRNCGYDMKAGNTEPDKSYTNRTGLGMDYNEGDWIMSRINRGINLSLSLSYRF